MSKKVGDYQIPFDTKGNQFGFGQAWGVVEWFDNFVFEDILTYKTFERGRSAAHMIMTRNSGRTVEVFLKDFEDMIPHLQHGRIGGTFTFTKRGQNFGCKLVKAFT